MHTVSRNSIHRPACIRRFIYKHLVLSTAVVGLLGAFKLVVSAGPSVPVLSADPNRVIPAHHFVMSCDQCHTAIDKQMGNNTLRPDVDQTCLQCHPMDVTLNHPVGVGPIGTVPTDLKLDVSGRMSCITCHDLNPTGGDPSRPYFLRRQPDELCMTCHANGTGSLRFQSHWQILSQAHLGMAQASPYGLPTSDQQFVESGLDGESRSCLSCHDGISAGMSGTHAVDIKGSSGVRQNKDHPVGVSLASAASAKPAEYHYPLRANSSIRLFEGNLGCGTCHSPYANNGKLLVDTFDRGVLCLHCHNK